MIVYSCNICGKAFAVRREFCPGCRGDNIQTTEATAGKIAGSVFLTATPEGQEDSYFILLVESHGMRLICRSPVEIPHGSKVTLEYRNEIPYAIGRHETEEN